MQPRLRPGITARSHDALGPVQPVDQPAINVTDADPEFALAKVVVHRVGRGKAGQVQNALIHSRYGDKGGVARQDAVHLDRDIQRPKRCSLGCGFNRSSQCPRTGVDLGIGQAQSPGRIATSGHIHGTQHRGRDIDAGAPIIGHVQRDQVLALLDLDRFHRDQSVRHHGDQRGPCRTRHDAQHRLIARLVLRLVQRQLQRVGGLRHIGRRVPAGIERRRGGGVALIAAEHGQFILPPIHRCRDCHRRRAKISVAAAHPVARRNFLPVPRPVLLIPLVMRFDPGQVPMHLHRCRLGIRADADQVEPRLVALGHHIGKQRLDADHRGGRGQQPRDAAFHRTARAFGNPGDKQRLQRALGVIGGGQGDVNRRLPRGIGAEIRKGLHLRAEGCVIFAKDIARPAVQRFCRAQQHFPLDGKIGPRCAKQVPGVNVQDGRIPQPDRRVGQSQLEVDAFGQEIFDQKCRADQRRRFQIAKNLHLPGAARRGIGNREVEHMAPRAQIVGHGAHIFHAIGPRQDRGQRQARQRGAFAVARQGGGMHRFTRAVRPPVGGQEHINRRCRRMPLDPAIRQVKLRVGQRQEGGVLAHLRHNHGRGGAIGALDQPGIKARIAADIGGHRPQHFIRDRQQLQGHARLGGGVTQRPHEHMQPVHA